MFPCLFFLAISTAYKMIQDRTKLEKEKKEKETENLKTELSFLRSQVSPHFMFNVLNNMVALARKKSDILESSLIKLSSLLRYMLYETADENVPLEKEIDYLQSYIDLQQQRFGKNLHVETCFSNSDKSYFIQPMLLIPFVENAFKHGTGMINDPFIHIKLKVEQSILKFHVSNRFNEASNEIKDKSSGIGLANVLRRLQLLYGTKQQIKIEKGNGIYSVLLQINLN
ncbi:MAG TPA: histidine kinase [Flavisolibacter sp.]|jgi:sensor histidine kinase YesM|nr:histidine kinase [Flavisolibacter sp.]